MSHPYIELEGTPLWEAVASAIDTLVLNQDLVEHTPRHYIIGYICKELLTERKTIMLQFQSVSTP